MTIFLIGALILALVLGIFYIKDAVRLPWFARLAHSEIIMRFAVFAAAMMLIGALLMIGDLLGN